MLSSLYSTNHLSERRRASQYLRPSPIKIVLGFILDGLFLDTVLLHSFLPLLLGRTGSPFAAFLRSLWSWRSVFSVMGILVRTFALLASLCGRLVLAAGRGILGGRRCDSQ